MIAINKDYISKENTYAGKNKPKYIVIHETDNWNIGSGAKRHAEAQSKGNLSMSVHYYSGSDGVYQAAEHTDGTYSVGSEYGGNHSITDATNRNTINIEICVNADGDYNVARNNAIELVKYLIQTTGIPAERVIRHYDAKGKYCPRKMMDKQELWEDFKTRIGNASVIQVVEQQKPQAEEWYRVGTDWKNGICQNQQGAYKNLNYAIADCKTGFNVYDSKGAIVYTNGIATQQTVKYTLKQFIKDVQVATGSEIDGYAGDETLRKTVTVSATKNRKHEVVKAIQKRLNTLGYDCGEVDGIAGSKFTAAVNKYQKEILRYKNPDGEITSGKTMWKSLLDMI